MRFLLKNLTNSDTYPFLQNFYTLPLSILHYDILYVKVNVMLTINLYVFVNFIGHINF